MLNLKLITYYVCTMNFFIFIRHNIYMMYLKLIQMGKTNSIQYYHKNIRNKHF